jgi:archaellum biogenesis ATPase FlaH
MSKRFKQVNVQHFATLVQEIDVSKLTQKEYVDIVEEIYMSIFRHNTSGDFVIPTMPNEEGNWKVHKSSATKEEVMKLIKEGRVTWNKEII